MSPVHRDGRYKEVYKFLATDVGVKDAIGNYITPTEFKIAPAADETLLVYSLMIHYDDAGTFDAGSYGNGIVLANGVSIQKKNAAGIVTDYNDGLPVLNNADWGTIGLDVTVSQYGTGNNHLHAKLSYFPEGGQPCKLDGANGEYLAVVLNDDFTGLVAQRFMVHGFNWLPTYSGTFEPDHF